MEHTQNYHLPQWVKSDRIMMDDFNAAMSSIESGLTAAQSTASAAQTAANAAGAKANVAYTPSNKPYVVGTYTGTSATNDKHDQNIYLGFRPSFLIISGDRQTPAGNELKNITGLSCMVHEGTGINNRITLTSTGFTVYGMPKNDAWFPDLNEKGRQYDYIAFR